MFLTIVAFFILNIQTDSLKIDTVAPVQSIMFKTDEEKKIARFKYQHSQGFFCDFEDKINKNKKINLNIGVGDQ